MTDHDIEVFYDGDCPLCMREIRLLRQLDKRQRIRFVDIAAKGFDAATLGAFSYEATFPDSTNAKRPDLVPELRSFGHWRIWAQFGPGERRSSTKRLIGHAEYW